MNKEFIPYEQALALKELGFNEPCFATYEFRKLFIGEFQNSLSFDLCKKTEVFPAPTFSQAFRWFREKYNLHISICHSVNGKFDCWTNDKGSLFRRLRDLLENDKYCNVDTYEEAELACLIKLIEIVKNKKS